MKNNDSPHDPRLLLAACIPAHVKQFGEWRSQPFDQLCLISDGDVGLEQGNRKFEIGAPTVILTRRGEKHGYWKLAGQHPNFWILCFRSNQSVFEQLPSLNHADPGKRIWRLSTNQEISFKGFFIRLVCERAAGGPSVAESAWLQLLMVTLQRWAEPKPWMGIETPASASDWRGLPAKPNGHARKLEPVDFELPTYESLQHLFRKTFGGTPPKL